MVVSHHKNVGQNHSVLTDKKPFENGANFRYLGATVTNQNCVREHIKSILNSRRLVAILFRVFAFLSPLQKL
jgi:hypothetical protein